MEHIADLIRNRRSVRTFDDREVSTVDVKKLSAFVKKADNPYDIPVEFRFLDAKEQKLTCPVVTGANLYVGAKARRVPHVEEAVGYSMERLVLYAQSLGIGTVWIGGTMDRGAFEKAMELGEGEIMPCISPLGYPAKKMSLRESMMRKAVKAEGRLPFETLFFDGAFGVPLSAEKAGKLADPLELVRRGPSAVNKQPWRVVASEKAVHFYLKRNKGYVSEAAGDMQKIDLGIALCHFALAAEEKGINLRFQISDPGITAEADTEYIASYLL